MGQWGSRNGDFSANTFHHLVDLRYMLMLVARSGAVLRYPLDRSRHVLFFALCRNRIVVIVKTLVHLEGSGRQLALGVFSTLVDIGERAPL